MGGQMLMLVSNISTNRTFNGIFCRNIRACFPWPYLKFVFSSRLFSFRDPVDALYKNSKWLDSFGIGKDEETVRKCTGFPVKSALYVRNCTVF